MSKKKYAFLSENLTSEERKKAFIKEYPDYADWPFWDDYGMPSPDPKELETFVEDEYGLGVDVDESLL